MNELDVVVHVQPSEIECQKCGEVFPHYFAHTCTDVALTKALGRVAELEAALAPFAEALRPWVDESGKDQLSVAPLDYEHYENASRVLKDSK